MTGRTKLQKQRDERRISQMYLQGEIQADIADALGLNQATISRTLKKLQGDWQKSALVDINEAKARELAKIDVLELEYWSAWKRSQENAEIETTKIKRSGPDTVDGAEKTKRVEGQSGNPAFLKGVEWCINKRCEILGIDAPEKLDLSNKDGTLSWAKFIQGNDNAKSGTDSE